MYNKIFRKILDSSIWLEPDSTRIVWLTLIAEMDEDGFCAFACPQNLANRAIVPLDKTDQALKTLENPDPNSADPEHEGRRIERVPGGWVVLNASKYRNLATRDKIREDNRRRAQAFRDRQRNAPVTHRSEIITPSKQSKAELKPSSSELETSSDSVSPSLRKKRPTRTSLPENFGISGEVRNWAAKNGYSLLEERLDHFIGYVKANGKTYADWDQAFQNAIRDDWAKLNGRGKVNGGGSPVKPPSAVEQMRKSLGVPPRAEGGIQ